MTNGEEFKSLQDFLAKVIVISLARRTPFEKHYIPLAICITLLQIAYETGAILGYARGNKIGILKKMLPMQGMFFGYKIKKDIQEIEEKRLDNFKKEHGEEPNTFADFIYWPLWEKDTRLNLETLFKSYGTESCKRSQKRITNLIQKKLNEKISIDEVESKIRRFLIKGLGFGCAFPNLTAKMYKNVYICKKYDEELWKITRSIGFATPIDMSKGINLHIAEHYPPSLKQSERRILGTVAFYVSQYYPELLDPLDLSYYLYLAENEKI